MPTVTGTVPLQAYADRVHVRTLGGRLVASLKYLLTTESHVYAFAIAASVLLSFIPFVVLLLSFAEHILHSRAASDAILAMLRDALPSNHEFITRNLQLLASSRSAQVVSLAMLLFTSGGVMLPLEVSLNRIWGFQNNRSYVRNQLVSFALAFCCGLLAVLSVLLTAVNLSAISNSFGTMGLDRTMAVTSWLAIKAVGLPTTILVLFLFYYVMPNGKVPVRPVLLAAVFAGIVLEVAKYVYIAVLPWLKFREVYGPFYVSVTLLMWAFVSAMILLAGAHFSAQNRPQPMIEEHASSAAGSQR